MSFFLQKTRADPLTTNSNPDLDAKTHSLAIRFGISLVKIISTFNIGRGGLSLSFMGNFITKSAHISLLKLVKDSLLTTSSTNYQIASHDLVRTVLCLKDQANSLYGTSWLIPLILHRESQIRSASFCLISILVNESFARGVLLTNQSGIWSIAFNVLLNPNECSIVRIQACAFLVNLTSTMSQNEDSISLTCLQALLNELNFYQQLAQTLTSFYPYETYSISNFAKQQAKNNELTTICSPLLVSSIAQLLSNLSVLMPEEATLLASNSGIMSLLTSYVKPINLLNNNNNNNNNNNKAIKYEQF